MKEIVITMDKNPKGEILLLKNSFASRSFGKYSLAFAQSYVELLEFCKNNLLKHRRRTIIRPFFLNLKLGNV